MILNTTVIKTATGYGVLVDAGHGSHMNKDMVTCANRTMPHITRENKIQSQHQPTIRDHTLSGVTIHCAKEDHISVNDRRILATSRRCGDQATSREKRIVIHLSS